MYGKLEVTDTNKDEKFSVMIDHTVLKSITGYGFGSSKSIIAEGTYSTSDTDELAKLRRQKSAEVHHNELVTQETQPTTRQVDYIRTLEIKFEAWNGTTVAEFTGSAINYNELTKRSASELINWLKSNIKS